MKKSANRVLEGATLRETEDVTADRAANADDIFRVRGHVGTFKTIPQSRNRRIPTSAPPSSPDDPPGETRRSPITKNFRDAKNFLRPRRWSRADPRRGRNPRCRRRPNCSRRRWTNWRCQCCCWRGCRCKPRTTEHFGRVRRARRRVTAC